MKILYIAANPYDLEELDLGPEVTEIQRRALGATSVDFIAMPSLKFEDLASTLHQHRPDILHGEPVSEASFPAIKEFNREFYENRAVWRKSVARIQQNQSVAG